MSGYTKTTIIDCPRSQSEEAQGFNNQTPSIWTNRVGDGFRLKPGDQISVHSSYISELGAQSGEIQIKGLNLNVDKEVSVTKTEKKLPEAYTPHEYSLYSTSNASVTVPTRDDTLNFVVSPYKTANGENYVHLPRRFATDGTNNRWNLFDKRDGTAVAADLGATYKPPNELNRCDADLHTVYEPFKHAGGTVAKKIAGFNDNKRYTIYRAKRTLFTSPTTAAVTILGKAKSGSPTIHVDSHSGTDELITGMVLTAQRPDSVFTGTDTILSFTDKTITMSANASADTQPHNEFVFSYPTSASDIFLPPDQSDELTAADAEALRDPAIFNEYEQVRDLVSVTVAPGYNTPEDIAQHMTEEINKRTDFVPKTGIIRNTATSELYYENISTISETPTYKLYESAVASYYEKAHYDEWFKTTGRNVGMAYSYLASYHHIGIKRPEIYNAGRKLNDRLGITTDSGDYQVIGDTVLMTPFGWDKDNLDLFKELFDAQAIYPELFNFTQSGIKVNASTSRFLHMNLFDDGPNNPDELNYPSSGMPVRSGSAVPSFGYDLYNNAVSASMTSFPIFFDYNPDTVNLDVNSAVTYADYGNTYGRDDTLNDTDYNQLVYGFARKVRRGNPVVAGEDFYIGLQFTKCGNKIPDHFFHLNSESSASELGTAGGRVMGYDYHFTAYGNAAILLYNGNANNLGNSYDGLVEKALTFAQKEGEKITYTDVWEYGVYLGAGAPNINYDQDQNRFQLSYLHSPEVVGNVYNAGRDDNKVKAAINGDSGLECYKVNKRLLKTNYTPEVTPYNTDFDTSFASASDLSYVAQNPSMETFTVFDAHSGLFIEDWIVGEKEWDNSLVGLMGFRYEQFHNPNSLSSRQVRIRDFGSNSQLNNVNIITTNANVNQADLVDWSKNLFSADNHLFTNQIGLRGDGFTSDPDRAHYLTPAVTVKNPGSVKITAKRLPTKTLRPYYTIRSDIILENNYLGSKTSGVTLPVVAITNKANPYGDFLNGIGGEIVFTNTIDRVLTKIKCSIHEPDGSAARVDLNSSVIFKIDQKVNADMNLVGTLLQSKKKNEKQVGMEAEDPLGGVDLNKIKYQFD